MTIEQAIRQAANELHIPVSVCKLAYRSMWKFIKERIRELPLKEDLTDEQFDTLKTNFNIPSIGKFYVTKDLYHRRKKRQEILNRLKEEKYGRLIQNQEAQTTVQSGGGDEEPV